MLNPFPDLLTFALIGPFLIRIAIGVFFLYSARETLKSKENRYHAVTHRLIPAASAPWITGILEGLTGLSLFLGLYTQVGAIAGIVLSLGALVALRVSVDKHARLVYVFTLVMSAALLFLGAGFLAFDLPL